MSKTVIISLGNGDFEQSGFTSVRVTLDDDNGKRIKDCDITSLPAAPDIPRIYRERQTIYGALLKGFPTLSALDDDDDDWPESIEQGAITNFSEEDFQELSGQLDQHFCEWLKFDLFRERIEDLIVDLNSNDEIRFIFEITDYQILGRLPWQKWKLFEMYPKAGMALSLPPSQLTSKVDREKIRILAILSDAPDVDNEEEKKLLESLPDDEVEIKLKSSLSRESFNNLLWDEVGWDVLFFSGHSKTEGKQGRIYINNDEKHNSLTIEQLKEALKKAIKRGLQLAIFNSCDGLGLASSLAELNIPAAIVMKEEVPNAIAQKFFCKFLANFREKDNLYLAEREAREWLRGWETKYPGASWLPVICQNKAVETLRWSKLQSVSQVKPKGETSLTISSKRNQREKLIEKLDELELEELDYLPEEPPQELLNKKAKIAEGIERIDKAIKLDLKKRSPFLPQLDANFVGREKTIHEIMAALKPANSPNPPRIIAIDGFGGVGKTAITQEIVQRSIKNNDFYFPIWQSAKPEIFTGGGVRKVDSATVDFEQLLTNITSNLGYVKVHQMKDIQDKRKLFREIINEENYLVVIDNLETMEESEQLVNDLDGLFDSSSNTKVIITTRKQVRDRSHVKPFQLKGLKLDESLEFLRVYAAEKPRASEIITSVDKDKLVTIHERTDGHPLAMKLMVGKLEGGFSIDRTLVDLEKVNFNNCESDETIYHQFYKFIFWDSWEQLSDLAQDLLILIGEFDLKGGSKIEDLIKMSKNYGSELTSSEIEDGSSELKKWSLLEFQGIDKEQTFFLHPFTYLFVKIDAK